MKKIITSIPNLLLTVLICFVLSSCSSTGVKTSDSSPWKTIQFEDQANALDVDFIDDKNGFLEVLIDLSWNLMMEEKLGIKEI